MWQVSTHVMVLSDWLLTIWMIVVPCYRIAYIILKRNRSPSSDLSPPPLRFGILGAARIAPKALITPAKTHADVVIAAVACRGKGRGESFAQKHKIPRTFTGPTAYQGWCATVVILYLPGGFTVLMRHSPKCVCRLGR